MFGYSAEELVGQNIKILMSGQDQHNHDDYISKFIQSGKGKVIGVNREVVGKYKNGAILPLNLLGPYTI